MQKKSESFSAEDIQHIAASPAAKQLLAFLQQTDSAALSKAMEQISAGNYQEAKKSLGSLMENQTAKELLNHIGGQTNG